MTAGARSDSIDGRHSRALRERNGPRSPKPIDYAAAGRCEVAISEDIRIWLERLGLGEYAGAFASNGIDFRALRHLTEEDLKELGVLLGHRRILRAAIDELAAVTESDVSQRTEPAAQAERRQVTVLFADLCGYTTLTARVDAEETHALLGHFIDRADAEIRDHGGTVDKHVGDSVMAVFGAPVAHGDDAARAARAALAIQAAMPGISEQAGHRLQVHIGVASGRVVASGVGADAHYTVTGDSVNLASRLTDAAGPGETLLSDAVQRAIVGRFDLEGRGTISVKGLAKPVNVYALRGEISNPRGDDRPFVGRRAELQQFEGALAACLETSVGFALVVRGEAGIGKTRLTEELGRMAAAKGFASHRVLVLDFGVGKGQDPVRALVRGLLAVPPASDKTARRQAAEAAVAEGLLAPEHAVHLNDLLDLPQPSELHSIYDAMNNATRMEGMRTTTAALVRSLSARQPLLLTVEDLHWADRQALDVLASLARAVVDRPAILIMTTRIEGDPVDAAWRVQTPGTTLMTLDLRPLRREEALALAAQLFESTEQFALRCIERADGNPLFLEQLLRNAEEAGEEAVPGSVQSIVQARMDTLAPIDKRALQAASVLGQRFSLDALRQLTDDPGYSCARLVTSALVRPEGSDFLFSHALVQEGVYTSLLKTRRNELHAAAAAWFAERDPVLRAEHLDRAHDPAAPAAYLAAARAQTKALRFDAALRLADRGIALAEEQGTRCDLTCLRGDALRNTGATDESIAAFEAALPDADDDARRCRAWIGMAGGLRVADRQDDALRALDNAEAAGQGRPFDLAWIHYLRGNVLFPLGRIEGCLTEHEKALRFAREAGSTEGEALALGGLGDAYYLRGHMRTACDHFRHCVDVSRRHGYGQIEVANRHMVGWTRLFLLELEGAYDDALDATALAASVSHHRAEQLAYMLAGVIKVERGHLQAADSHLARALELALLVGARNFEAQTLQWMAQVQADQGDLPRATETLRQALAVVREVGMTFIGPSVLATIARLSTHPAERRARLREAETALDAGCVSHNQFWFARDAITVALEDRLWDEAERHAARLEAYTRAQPLAWADFQIARARALAAWGRGDRSEATAAELERLLDEARRTGMERGIADLAQALADL